MSASLVVTYKGQLIAERYGEGIDIHTPLESWSMGKSLTATLLGLLVHEGEYTLDEPSAEDRAQASESNIQKMDKFVQTFANKSGTMLHPNREITDFLVIGLAKNIDETGKQLCPCMFFEDKEEEIRKKSWICPCEEMQRWKYCH